MEPVSSALDVAVVEGEEPVSSGGVVTGGWAVAMRVCLESK